MTLYVDGDAFPNLLKKILFKAIERLSIKTVVVANKQINIGQSPNISYLVVDAGADEADNRIVELLTEGDLVITADIPLADRVIEKKAQAIDHRGGIFNENNIKNILALRNIMQDIRDSGEITKGPPPFNRKDANGFANQLDKILTKYNQDLEKLK